MENIHKAILKTSADGEQVAVIEPVKSCGGCKGCGICGGLGRQDEIEIPLSSTSELPDGSEIKVEVSVPNRIHSALLLFILPMTDMFIAAAAGYFLYKNTGMIVGGAIGLLAGFLSLRIICRRWFRVTARIIP